MRRLYKKYFIAIYKVKLFLKLFLVNHANLHDDGINECLKLLSAVLNAYTVGDYEVCDHC